MRSDNENPTPWSILLGSHGYGMTPEMETAWARVFLLAGLMGGVFASWVVVDVLRSLS
jgi:hypothetical protein